MRKFLVLILFLFFFCGSEQEEKKQEKPSVYEFCICFYENKCVESYEDLLIHCKEKANAVYYFYVQGGSFWNDPDQDDWEQEMKCRACIKKEYEGISYEELWKGKEI